MKKLLSLVACVVASVGLCAQDTFENREVGAFTDSLKENTLWVAASADAEIVQETENKFLQISDSPATDPLYRAYSVTLKTQDGDYNPDPITVPAAGVYFDSKVKFSVSDTLDQGAISEEYAKFAIFAYCDDDAETKMTNLVARAAFYTDEVNKTATNFFLSLPEGVTLDSDTWHRLTIKTIPLATTAGRYGFIAYLDGNLLSYDSDVTCGTAETFVNSLTATAKKYYDNHSLLPGMTSSAQIDRVLFAGTGALDDVDWSTTAPDFAKDETLITLTWDEGVASLTFGTETVNVTEPGTKDFTVAADTAAVTITATLKDGYAFSSWTNGEKATTEPTTYAVTTYAYQMTVDGVAYEKTDDAVAAAIKASKPLVLAKDLTTLVKAAEGTLIIDLNGHDITVSSGSYDQPIYLLENSKLVITNSSTTVGTVCGITSEQTGGTYSIYTEESGTSVTVYENCKFEGDIIAENTVTCYGGIFKNTDETTTEFPYDLADDENYEATLAEGYWTVAKKTTKTALEIFIADIAAAADGATVTLTDNITLTSRIDVDCSGKTVTLDLGGYTVKPTESCGNGSAFNIKSGTVTIQNGTIDGTAIVDAEVKEGSKECDAITVRKGAKVTLVDTLTVKIASRNGACVYVFDGGNATITGGVYQNSTTEDYQYKAGFKGMTVNQANVESQLIVLTGGKFSQQDPSVGDDAGKCTTFLADGYESVKGTDGFYTVQKKTTPTKWEDVDTSTQTIADVVPTDQVETITKANITVEDLKTWATNHGVTTAPGVALDIEALTLNCAPGTANVAAAKDAFKATQAALDEIMKADAAGDETALANSVKDLYKETYPNSTVTVQKITDENKGECAIYSTDTLKVFRLVITLGK